MNVISSRLHTRTHTHSHNDSMVFIMVFIIFITRLYYFYNNESVYYITFTDDTSPMIRHLCILVMCILEFQRCISTVDSLYNTFSSLFMGIHFLHTTYTRHTHRYTQEPYTYVPYDIGPTYYYL